MAVHDDGLFLANRVRELCARPGSGLWKGAQISELLDRAKYYSGDHQRFYLAFLDGIRDLIDDEDCDAVLVRFAHQALRSESRILADSGTIRDHLAHVTQVFLVGWFVLNECEKFRTLGDEWMPYGWARGVRFDLLNRAWLFTALLHDCAYSVEESMQAREHEVRVRAMFGDMYTPGVAGRVDERAARRAGSALWKRRAEIIGAPIDRDVRECMRRIETCPDHAFVTGQALIAESSRFEGTTRDVLEIAGVSLACHNFRWQIDPNSAPAPTTATWFSVNFWQEPLAALLTVSDEIQEWGRERADLALSFAQHRKDFLPVQTVLTALHADDAAGLTIDARLLFLLTPEDRPHRVRRANDRDVKNAESTRQYRNAFQARGAVPDTFELHLRIAETVEDVPCGVPRCHAWPRSGRGTLRERGMDALSRPGSWPDRLQPARACTPSGAQLELSASGLVRVERNVDKRLRIVMVAPGGSGKSTLLRAVAKGSTLGRRTARFLYVEELDDDRADLAEECTSLRDTQCDADVVLVIDHLDRIVATPYERYWLDQIQSLPDVPWLHIIGACRPEEFSAFIKDAFESYEEMSLVDRVGPLMESDDPGGRATVRAIERHLVGGPEELDQLGWLAIAMKQHRYLERPAVHETGVTFAGYPALESRHGRLRFVHDVIQDYLSARLICRELRDGSDPGALRANLRRLFDLPRDVLRLVLDVLTHSRRLSDRERRAAAQGFARAVQEEATVLQWAYDLGRLAQAQHIVEPFRDRFADVPAIAAIADTVAGQVHYDRHRSSMFDDPATRTRGRDTARATVTPLSRALASLASVWPPDVENLHAEVVTAYIADHLLVVLARAALLEEQAFADAERERLLAELSELRRRKPEGRRLDPAVVLEVLQQFDTSAPLRVLWSLDDRLRDAASSSETRRRVFGLRRWQLASHIGGSYFLARQLDRAGFEDGLRWQDRAIARAEYVLRVARDPAFEWERFGSVAHGRGAVARNCSAKVFLWSRAFQLELVDRREARYRLLEAVQTQEAAWRFTQAALLPGERFTQSFWLGMADTALGATLKAADAKPFASPEEIRRHLAKEQDRVILRQRTLAERPVREREPVFAHHERRLGDLVAFVASFQGED